MDIERDIHREGRSRQTVTRRSPSPELEYHSPQGSRHGTSEPSTPVRSPEDIGDEPLGSSGDSATTSDDSQDEVEDVLATLAEEGGVEFLNHLLARAVSTDSEVLDTSNIREWSFKDIMRMPSAQQKGWMDACKQELDSLHARDVYDLVDPPPGRRIIKNRWVFDQKTDGRKRARLVAKGFSQVKGIDYSDIFRWW